MSLQGLPDLAQAVAIATIAGAAFAAGRMRERVAALSRHVTVELKRFSAEMTTGFASLDRRMTAFEEFLPYIFNLDAQ
jgi:hypothetical protein